MSQFKKIPYIPTSEKLADMIFSKLKKIQVESPKRSKQRRRSDYSFYKTLYFRQFRYLFPELEEKLQSISDNFPIIDNLHPFHRELIEALIGTDKLRTSLSRILNTQRSVKSIERDVSKKLGHTTTAEEAKEIRKEAIGRLGSTINKLKRPLDELIDAKIQLSKVPDFNINEKTIAFAGGPNAGKSSFVKLVSTGNPEIAAYPFTTKELVCGHRRNNFESVQLVDTPGMLDRPLSERNAIEMRSIIALKHLADVIVYLFDPTNDSPLSLAQQLNLLEEIKNTFPEITIYTYINKKDVLTKELEEKVFGVIGEHPLIATLDSYKDELEVIIVNIINKIPDRKLFVKPDELKPIEEASERRKSRNKIEWIFFDEDD